MRVLGVMSGTSVDAIDVALADLTLAPTTAPGPAVAAPADAARIGAGPTHMNGTDVDRTDVDRAGTERGDAGAGDARTLVLRPLGHRELPWPAELRDRLVAASGSTGAASGRPTGGVVGAEAWCRLHADVGRAFGAACATALSELGPAHLVACHGQTLHHLVENGEVVGTLQVGAPAYVHAATGLPVVSDVRTADIAAGGQGAPLASTLDSLWLGDTPTAVLNLGGIANVTIVGTSAGVLAGDTGPANALLDSAATDLGATCDVDGRLAATGRVDEAALTALLADPYFARPLPKSTGRDYFDATYVARRLGAQAPTGVDLFATLTEFTARTVVDAIRAADPTIRRVVVSGGGVRNPVLLGRLGALAGVPVLTSDELGIPAAAKEGYLMAVLGWLGVHGRPGVVAGRGGRPVTGAAGAAVLGSLTPPYVDAALAAALADPAPTTPPTRLVVAEAAGPPLPPAPTGGTGPAHPGDPGRAGALPPAPSPTGPFPTAGSGAADAPAASDLTWSTEQPLRATRDLDTLASPGVVAAILDADATVAAAVRAVAADLARAVDLVVAAIHGGGVVHYVGAGTSGRMGVLDAVELLPTYHVGPDTVRAHLAGGAAAMMRAVEGAEDDAAAGAALAEAFGPSDLVVGIAASGRTPYVRGALEAARRAGLSTVLVSANPAAPLAEFADVAILPDTGPEVVTGSTRMKAATAQKMVLNALSTAAMVRLGKTYGNLMVEMVPTNAKLRARSVRMLAQGSARSEADCAEALAAAGGDVRRALVALLAGLPPRAAGDPATAAALAAYPPDPGRPGDPSGLRSAATSLRR